MKIKIIPGQSYNFDKKDAQTVTSYGAPYDYDSVMHYRIDDFSKQSGLATIRPKVSSVFLYILSRHIGNSPFCF
jgi:hypothetical protein